MPFTDCHRGGEAWAWESLLDGCFHEERHPGVAVEGRWLGLNGGMGENIEPESTLFLDTFGPKREERMRVATERGKDTLENSGVFLLQDLADLFI